MVIVSHDRAFLDRTVTDVLELDEHTRTGPHLRRRLGGLPAPSARPSGPTPPRPTRVYESQRAELRRRAQRERQWATTGVAREKKQPARQRQGAAGLPHQPDREAWPARARRTERALDVARGGREAVGGLGPALQHQRGDPLRRRRRAAGGRRDRAGRLHPRPPDPGHRLGRPRRARRPQRFGQDDARRGAARPAAAGRGDAAHGPERRRRRAGPGPARPAARARTWPTRSSPPPASPATTPGRSWPSSGWAPRPCSDPPSSLSPGERTRAELAAFAALRRQLPRARRADQPPGPAGHRAAGVGAPAGTAGTLLLVSHDRRLLETVTSDPARGAPGARAGSLTRCRASPTTRCDEAPRSQPRCAAPSPWGRQPVVDYGAGCWARSGGGAT